WAEFAVGGSGRISERPSEDEAYDGSLSESSASGPVTVATGARRRLPPGALSPLSSVLVGPVYQRMGGENIRPRSRLFVSRPSPPSGALEPGRAWPPQSRLSGPIRRRGERRAAGGRQGRGDSDSPPAVSSDPAAPSSE